MNRRKFAGRQLGRGIDDHRNAALMRDLADQGQRHRAGGEDRAGDRRRPLADRRGDLPRLSAAGPGIAEIANLDHAHPDGADGVVVGIAVSTLDDDLVLQARCVRQAIHRRHVHPGDAGGDPNESPAAAPLTT